MRKAIGSFAFGLVLLCSTAWADESNKEKADQLKKLVGIWEFFVEIPGTGRTNQWYRFNRLDFLPEGTPFLNGTDPITKNSVVFISRQSEREHQFIMEQVEEVGENGLLCMTFIFSTTPIDYWSSELLIHGDVRMAMGVKKHSQDGKTYKNECFFDRETTQRGIFTGIKR